VGQSLARTVASERARAKLGGSLDKGTRPAYGLLTYGLSVPVVLLPARTATPVS